MELCRSLVIRNISAEDLEDVRRMFRMKVYAMVSISGDPFIPSHTWNETHVDYEGGTNPTWETHFSFTIHDPSLQRNLQRLNLQFHCERRRGNKSFGEFSIPVKCLFDKVGNHNVSSSVSYPVKTASGGEQGVVKFTFEFGKPLARVVTPSRGQPPPNRRVPPRSQPPARPQVSFQSGVGVQVNVNISGDCEQQGYTDIGCDGEDELAYDVEQELNISADCQQRDTPAWNDEGCDDDFECCDEDEDCDDFEEDF